MNVEFTPESELGKVLADFWSGLKDNGSARAELRRCASVQQVMLTPAFTRLLRKFQTFTSEQKLNEYQLAIIVGLVSHLKFDAESVVLEKSRDPVDKLVSQMAELVSSDRPLVSELRFRRLIQCDRDDLYPAMIRIIRLMKGRANLFGLAQSVYFWGDSIKKRWAYAYFPRVPEKKSA